MQVPEYLKDNIIERKHVVQEDRPIFVEKVITKNIPVDV